MKLNYLKQLLSYYQEEWIAALIMIRFVTKIQAHFLAVLSCWIASQGGVPYNSHVGKSLLTKL